MHPLYGDARLAAPKWDGRLLIGGSESAGRSGGYLEGALEAAARIAAQLASRTPPSTGASGARNVETEMSQAGTGR
jgi:monoamine oxidase